MCMLFVNNNTDAKDDEYAMTILSIRDESYDRPTRSTQTWSSNPAIFGGMDMEEGREGGTWMALNRDMNKLAMVLRILRPLGGKVTTASNTRGFLVPRFMDSSLSGSEYLESIVEDCDDYPAYSLVTFDLNQPKNGENNEVSYFCNVEPTMPSIADDSQILAFSNNRPHKLWQKTEVGRDYFRDITQKYPKKSQKAGLISQLFIFASDDTQHYPDPVLDEDGSGYELEYLQGISSINCKIPLFQTGTRTQTVILIDKVGNVEWIERDLSEDNLKIRGNKYAEWPTKKFDLRLNSRSANNQSYITSHL